ncbi:unnamed protein product [Mytilus coruscus]|uniref:Uncharacterized protein n=1 Tax=Mytilus coruscus TaxID=42192 RepID=A0A6J8DLG5_MYTCO|nr:unnamed protein product [Mytilus coruscus]
MAGCHIIRIVTITLVLVLSTQAVTHFNQMWKKLLTSRKFTTITKENLQKYFPGYFRTPSEQLEYERLILYGSKNKIPVSTQSMAPYNYHCNVDCRRRYGPFHNMRFKRQARGGSGNNDDFMHACCVTNVFFETPDLKPSVNGDNRNLLHLPGMRQVFKVENCSQAAGCTGCRCMHEQSLASAVVIKKPIPPSLADEIDDLEIELFYFSGCCKCVNNG